MEKEASSECSEDFPMSEEEDPHTSAQLVIYRLSHFLPAANTFPFMPAFPGVRIFSERRLPRSIVCNFCWLSSTLCRLLL